MHKYLRAIGFSKIKNRRELRQVLNRSLKDATEKQYVSNSDDVIAVEYRKEFAVSMGIAVCGEYSDDVEFDYDFYYPYYVGGYVSSSEDVTIEKNSDRDTYAGVCDELKVGVTLIFFLQNRLDYVKLKNSPKSLVKSASVNFSALSVEGTIMLPLSKNPSDMRSSRKADRNRNELLEAARNGDENAIENLTLDDIDTYSAISRKIVHEDIYTIVDTYLMPYGIECDKYSILGEILSSKTVENSMTREKVHIITVQCNDVIIEVCINSADLIGEPAPHRRFKGVIWLQGHVNFLDN